MQAERVAVIGTGATKFGELWDKSLRDLLAESQLKALEDAHISPRDINMIITGNMCSGTFTGQEHVGAMAADILNSTAASFKVEGACASGSLAFRAGLQAIQSGAAEVVLVNGTEKMTDVQTRQATAGLLGAGDEVWEGFTGVTFCGLYAMMARAYMHQFGLTREQLAMVAVKNHKHGSLNPIAQFKNQITVDQVLNSSMIADPLTLLDCSPITDGSASVVLASEAFAKKHCDTPIWVAGSGQASDTLALHSRPSLTEIPATSIATRIALDQAKITTSQIDVTEIHDCFTIAEIIAMEGLGLVERGKAGKLIEEGQTYYDGKTPVNPCGGLKACGHPVGATGVKQIMELVHQLRGEAGKRQVQDATTGLAHNVGGTGATVVVHVLQR